VVGEINNGDEHLLPKTKEETKQEESNDARQSSINRAADVVILLSRCRVINQQSKPFINA